MHITEALNEAERWLTHQEHLRYQEEARSRAAQLALEGRIPEAAAIQKQLDNTQQDLDPVNLNAVIRALVADITETTDD